MICSTIDLRCGICIHCSVYRSASETLPPLSSMHISIDMNIYWSGYLWVSTLVIFHWLIHSPTHILKLKTKALSHNLFWYVCVYMWFCKETDPKASKLCQTCMSSDTHDPHGFMQKLFPVWGWGAKGSSEGETVRHDTSGHPVCSTTTWVVPTYLLSRILNGSNW